MEHLIKVEMTVKMDKNIYENSLCPKKEEFFQKMVTNYVDTDLPLFKREQKTIEDDKKEDYTAFVRTLEDMKKSINDSIQFDVMKVDGQTEEVKVSFSFKYYPTSIVTIERTIESFIFITPIQDNARIADEMSKALDSEQDILNQEKIKQAVNMFNHVSEFLEEAKKSLIIYKDGVVLDTPVFPKTNKLFM